MNCCRVCKTGKACGDSYIARTSTCNQPPGCAPIGEGADGAEILDVVTKLAAGRGRNIPQTSTKDGGVAMWLVQMAATGFFKNAAQVLERGCVILEGALAAHAKAAMEAALKG